MIKRKFLYLKQENNLRNIFTEEITPVEIGETVAKVQLLIVAYMFYQSGNTESFYMFVQNWNTDINNSTRARCYILYADFRFQPYLNLINQVLTHKY